MDSARLLLSVVESRAAILGNALHVTSHEPYKTVHRDDPCTIRGIISIAFNFFFFSLHLALGLSAYPGRFFLSPIGNVISYPGFSDQVWKTGQLAERRGLHFITEFCTIRHHSVVSFQKLHI